MQFSAVVQEQLAKELAKTEAIITEFRREITALGKYAAKHKASKAMDKVSRRLRAGAMRVLRGFCVSGDVFVSAHLEPDGWHGDTIWIQLCGGLRVWFWQDLIRRPDPTLAHSVLMGAHHLYMSMNAAQDLGTKAVLKFSARRSDVV